MILSECAEYNSKRSRSSEINNEFRVTKSQCNL